VSYESWRISYQSSEQAALASFRECMELRAQLEAAKKHISRLGRELNIAITTIELAAMPDGEAAKRLAASEARAGRLEGLYNELLFAVGMKHRDETRHQTALRYIQRAEAPCTDSRAALAEGEAG